MDPNSQKIRTPVTTTLLDVIWNRTKTGCELSDKIMSFCF